MHENASVIFEHGCWPILVNLSTIFSCKILISRWICNIAKLTIAASVFEVMFWWAKAQHLESLWAMNRPPEAGVWFVRWTSLSQYFSEFKIVAGSALNIIFISTYFEYSEWFSFTFCILLFPFRKLPKRIYLNNQ